MVCGRATPACLSAQFVTYQDASAGIYLASQDSTGYQKLLAIWKKEDGFGICHDFFLPAAPVRWRSPYPVSIGVTQGSWQDFGGHLQGVGSHAALVPKNACPARRRTRLGAKRAPRLHLFRADV